MKLTTPPLSELFPSGSSGRSCHGESGVTPSAFVKLAAKPSLPNGCSAAERRPGASGRPPSCFEYGIQSPVFCRM